MTDSDKVRPIRGGAGYRSPNAKPGEASKRELNSIRQRSKLPHLAASRELAAIELYNRCLTFQQIADAMEVPKHIAYDLVRKGLARRAALEPATVAEARALMTDRLDLLLSKWFPMAMDGNDKAAEITLKLLDRVGEVHGVDLRREAQVQVTINVESMRDDVLRSLDEVARRARLIEGVVVDDEPG